MTEVVCTGLGHVDGVTNLSKRAVVFQHFQRHQHFFVVSDGVIGVVVLCGAHPAAVAKTGEVGRLPFTAGDTRFNAFQATAVGTDAGMMLGAVLFALRAKRCVD